MEHAPYERLKWRVLRYAGALPSEKRAQEMTDADYLYCLVHEMLDREEAMERLCPFRASHFHTDKPFVLLLLKA